VPIILGGLAIRDDAHAIELGADAYAPDAATLVDLLDEHRRRSVV
jgi:hypothetical protein